MLKKKKVLIFVIIVFLCLLAILFIYHFRVKIGKIFIPFFIAGVIAYLISPLVLRLEKKKVPRSVSILLIYLITSIITITTIVFIIPEVVNNIKDLIKTLPDITLKYQGIINNTMSAIESSRWTPEVKIAISNELQSIINSAQGFIMNLLKKSLDMTFEFAAAILDLILAMIIAYYFIKDAEVFKAALIYLIPKKMRNRVIAGSTEINAVLSNFIKGQLLTAIIVAALQSIGLYIVNVKYPLALGILAGIANIIPYFGPLIGAIPAIAVALIQSPMKAVWTAVAFIIVQQIDNAFISPKIIESKLGLHPVTTILAVLVGGEFFGVLGMLIAVPILAIIKVIFKRIIEALV